MITFDEFYYHLSIWLMYKPKIWYEIWTTYIIHSTYNEVCEKSMFRDNPKVYRKSKTQWLSERKFSYKFNLSAPKRSIFLFYGNFLNQWLFIETTVACMPYSLNHWITVRFWPQLDDVVIKMLLVKTTNAFNNCPLFLSTIGKCG